MMKTQRKSVPCLWFYMWLKILHKISPWFVWLRQPWFKRYVIELIKWVDFEAWPIKKLAAPVLSLLLMFQTINSQKVYGRRTFMASAMLFSCKKYFLIIFYTQNMFMFIFYTLIQRSSRNLQNIKHRRPW